MIASFVTGPGATTLPMAIFATVRRGVNPEINALASLILFVVGLVGFIAGALWRTKKTAIARYSESKTWLSDATFANISKADSVSLFLWSARNVGNVEKRC